MIDIEKRAETSYSLKPNSFSFLYTMVKNTLLHLSLLGTLVPAALASTTDEKQEGPLLRKRMGSDNERELQKGSLEKVWDQVAADSEADEYNELTRGLMSLAPTFAPVNLPTLSPVVCEGVDKDDYLLALLSQITPESKLLDRFSPQGKAFEFLKNDPYMVDPCGANVAQRYGIATFYYSTSGDQWTSSDGWLGADSVCTWEGVTCDASGMVAKIDLGKWNDSEPRHRH